MHILKPTCRLQEEHNIVASEFLTPTNGHRIFNLDESGFPLAGKNDMKIVSEKGKKNIYNVSSETKEHITVLICASANGEFEKPLVIFPGVRPNYEFGSVSKDIYNLGKSPNRWISSDSFFSVGLLICLSPN